MSTVTHENTPAAGVPSRGSMVVYVDGTRENGQERFRMAEVTGPAGVDPVTGATWVGVLLPEIPSVVDMIDCASVVNVVPPR